MSRETVAQACGDVSGAAPRIEGVTYGADMRLLVNVGQTPVAALGTTDQHSQVQLYMEGPNDKVFTFLQVKQFDELSPIPDELKDVDAFAISWYHPLTGACLLAS